MADYKLTDKQVINVTKLEGGGGPAPAQQNMPPGGNNVYAQPQMPPSMPGTGPVAPPVQFGGPQGAGPQGSGPKITVYVRTPQGTKAPLEVPANEPIESFKRMAAVKAMLPEASFSLAYAGRKFENGKTLADYFVEDECVVRLAIEESSA